ncbi:glycoside hydrolase family 32 protein [Kribbella sp. NBC_01505]|uniref:glycoside hydrolase family 32 protein n=1 Tax=Kribbella sp. NBC_01505 TaxID=2903580 RepID=UPI003863A6C6
MTNPFPYAATNYQEDNRGQFHFSPRSGWMNDPNAPLYYRGVYHLYFQHAPNALQWDTMHWGHATSTDLVHWQQRPIALDPSIHPGDLWSGGGVVDCGNDSGLKNGDHDPIIVYSGTRGVTVFYSLDGGYTFQTYDGGRKVVVPEGDSRDPKVFWDPVSQRWGMVVWSDAGGNGVDFFSSDDLLHWAFASRFKAGWLFECPNMIRMPFDGGYQWVLHAGSGEYYVGDWDGTAFRSDWTTPQKINQTATHAGAGYYAALNFSNLKGDRVVSMAWQGENYGSIWTGNASFPVDLKLRRTADGIRVVSTPVSELDTLRENTRTWKNLSLDSKAARQLLAGVRVNTYELEAVVDVRDLQRLGIRLHTGPDGWFDREVVYDARAQELNGVGLRPQNGKVKLRLLVDRGQLDVFGNDGDVYQSFNVNFDGLPGGDGLELFAEGRLRLDSLTIHELASIWRPLGEATLHTNLGGPWYAARGQWADVADGKQGKSPGDAFYLSTAKGSDFTLDGDVRLVDGVAAALTFRATRDASQHYTVNVDAAANVVKLWRPGRDIASVPLQVERGRTCHFTVQTAGPNIKVALDGKQVIDAIDTAHAAGQFGMNVYNGTALVQNVSVR